MHLPKCHPKMILMQLKQMAKQMAKQKAMLVQKQEAKLDLGEGLTLHTPAVEARNVKHEYD